MGWWRRRGVCYRRGPFGHGNRVRGDAHGLGTACESQFLGGASSAGSVVEVYITYHGCSNGNWRYRGRVVAMGTGDTEVELQQWELEIPRSSCSNGAVATTVVALMGGGG